MLAAFQWFIDLGVVVVLPILILIFGLALGTKLSVAFLAGIKVGIGFTGLNLVIGLMAGGLGSA
ncbi:MAG: PTS galactitol transporter subunit IIC, partial [Defluviitaleaceae bacterium]|nr:PTS galactitol transporter subunit IIC [Defluviitaleaceae bacterium]